MGQLAICMQVGKEPRLINELPHFYLQSLIKSIETAPAAMSENVLNANVNRSCPFISRSRTA